MRLNTQELEALTRLAARSHTGAIDVTQTADDNKLPWKLTTVALTDMPENEPPPHTFRISPRGVVRRG